MSEKFPLTPEQGYRLMIAALDLVSGPSPDLHARLRRDRDRGRASSRPQVRAGDLLHLADVLNELSPGIVDATLSGRHS